MINLTEKETTVLQDLRKNVEQIYREGWGSVYLGNCLLSGTATFSGVLASLKKKGYYEPVYDEESPNCFGEVLLEKGDK